MPAKSHFHINRDLLVYKAFYFFFLSAFGSIFPYLPVYFRQIGLPASQVGLLIGVRPIVQLASAPFWAIVADKYRKRKAVLVMSILAWLIMTLSLAFVEPTNEICELRAGNGSDAQVVNYTKVKTGFFRRALLSVQKDVNRDHVEQSPDLVVVAVRPRLSTQSSPSVAEDSQSGSGQNSRGVFLSGSSDHDFVHDEVSSLQYDRTGGKLVKAGRVYPVLLDKKRIGKQAIEGVGLSNSASRTSRKRTWSHRKNNSHAFRQRKRAPNFKTATRVIHLSGEQLENTNTPSKANYTSTPTRDSFGSQTSLGKQTVKSISQVVRGSIREKTKAASRSSSGHSSETPETGKRQSFLDREDALTTDRHKSDKKRKNTRNEKSGQRPPIVIEFSRILIPQEENNTKSLLHHYSSEKRNGSTRRKGDRVFGPVRHQPATNREFALPVGFPFPISKSKDDEELQSILQLRQPPFEKTNSRRITNSSSSQESAVDPEQEGSSSGSNIIQENELASGRRRPSSQTIGNFPNEHDHNPNAIGNQLAFKDSLHETLGDIVTKVIHNSKDFDLDSGINKLLENETSGTMSEKTRLNENNMVAGTTIEQLNTTATGVEANNMKNNLKNETTSGTMSEKTRLNENNMVAGTTIEQVNTSAPGVDSNKMKSNLQLDGEHNTKVANRTEGPEFVAAVDVSAEVETKLQLSRNDSKEPQPQMVAEHVSGREEDDITTLAAALLSTKNLLKENVSELKRIFTILLVLIVVGEFLEAPSFTLADASLLEILGEERRYYGKQRLWGSLGFGIFSFLIGVLLERSKHLVCGEQYTDYMICFCVFAILMVCTLLVSTAFHFQYNGSKVEHSSVMHSLCNFHYGSCLVAACFMGVGHGMSHNFVNWFLEDLGGSKTLMGCAVICRCAADLLTFFVAGSLIKYVGQIRLMIVSLISYGVIFASYSLLSNPWWVLPVEALNGMTYAASWSACTSYMAGAVSPEAVTTVQGILQGVYWGLGTGSGTITGGYLIHHVGPVLTFRLTSCSYFVVCALFSAAQFKWTKGSTDVPQTKYEYLPTVKTKDTEALLSGCSMNTKKSKAKMKPRYSKY